MSVEIENQQFKKIKGDEKHPFSQGYICQKAARLQHYHQHTDRLTAPLKRQADGSFQEISWEQAIQEIADQLLHIRDTFGGTAFASVGGGGQGNHLGAAYGRQLVSAMKSYYSYFHYSLPPIYLYIFFTNSKHNSFLLETFLAKILSEFIILS